jgi:site-specific DNA-methyltransferase (adenine-specific)
LRVRASAQDALFFTSSQLRRAIERAIIAQALRTIQRVMQLPYLNHVLCGDSACLLRELPSDSVDLVITSPPYYKQRDYGSGIGNEATPQAYLESLLSIFGECVRIIKPTGSLVFNLGDKYEASSLLLMPYRFAIAATERFPVKLVNNVTWVKLNPTPRQFQRRLVSSTEPFFHFVKSDQYQYFPESFLSDGAADADSDRDHRHVGQRYFSLIAQSALSEEQKAMARTALEAVIQEVQSGLIHGFRMKIRGIHAEPFGGQEGGRKTQLARNGFTIIRIHGNRLKRDVITTPVESTKGNPHPASYPVKIVEEFIRLLTQPKDVVLDPFAGAGTTAIAALKTDRQYICFDINEVYCAYARERIQNFTFTRSLFWQ